LLKYPLIKVLFLCLIQEALDTVLVIN